MIQKKLLVVVLLLFFVLISGCKTTKKVISNSPDKWVKLSKANDVEIYVDTTSIRREGAIVFAIEKRVFLTDASKTEYTNLIKREYEKMGNPEKANKWNDFSYSLSYNEYECTNSRFRVLWVEDYDSAGKRIVRTRPAKDKIKWINVADETVGDYNFFYICDFGN